MGNHSAISQLTYRCLRYTLASCEKELVHGKATNIKHPNVNTPEAFVAWSFFFRMCY